MTFPSRPSVPADHRLAWGRFREHLDLKLSSLLGLSRWKLFVLGGCGLCDEYICFCIIPHVSSCLSRFCRKCLEVVQISQVCVMVAFLFLPWAPPACELCDESATSLWVFIFRCFRRLVSKTAFRTSHQTLHSREMIWFWFWPRWSMGNQIYVLTCNNQKTDKIYETGFQDMRQQATTDSDSWGMGYERGHLWVPSSLPWALPGCSAERGNLGIKNVIL